MEWGLALVVYGHYRGAVLEEEVDACLVYNVLALMILCDRHRDILKGGSPPFVRGIRVGTYILRLARSIGE